MAKDIQQFEQDLFAESDGSKFSKIKDKFIKEHGTAALPALTRYVQEGKIIHWRNFLLTDIINLIRENDSSYKDFFAWALTQKPLVYWSIDGLLKSAGSEAYETIVAVASDENAALDTRAKAIKSLAVHSKQPFDRSLPTDPGYWKKENLRLEELTAWKQNGYPQGGGYATPEIHSSLQHPVTDLEKAAAALDKILKAQRAIKQDPASPSNWLTIADPASINAIQQKWTLPYIYLQFLQQFSPLKVYIDNEEFFQGLNLYGAKELIEMQNGYAFDTVKQTIIKDWPQNFVVIADAGGDPYCIDINNENAPVYSSMHGTGAWEFELYAESFLEFLQQLST